MSPDGLIDQLIEACDDDGRYIRLALAEVGCQFVEEYPHPDFLVQRVRALREEDIIYDWSNE